MTTGGFHTASSTLGKQTINELIVTVSTVFGEIDFRRVSNPPLGLAYDLLNGTLISQDLL